MTATEPNIPDNGRYTVTQAAEILGVKRITINRYEKKGLLIASKSEIKDPAKSKIKRLIKTFTGKEIKRCWRQRY